MEHVDFILYANPVSANGRKVLAVANQLGLQPKVETIDVYQGDGQQQNYLAINPFGKIPSLVDGDFLLWESNAILIYMAEAYADCLLYSKLLQQRADINRWLFWEAAHWQPAISNILAATVGHRLLPQYVPEPEQSPDWQEPEFHRLVTFLDVHLSEQHYLTGEVLTIADFSVAGMMTYFNYTQFPFADFPGLHQWYQRLAALPAWQQTSVDLWT